MYNLLFVISLAQGGDHERASLLAAELSSLASALDAIRNVMAQPTLPGVYNGGDLLFRVVFDDEAAFERASSREAWQALEARLGDASAVRQLQRVEYEGGESGGMSGEGRVYRVALFCANVDPTPERLEAFGRQTASMPRYIKSIRRWQLSNAAKASGTRPWTHVWEQEYQDLEGLNGPYMMHPAHWAHVERWFDTEYPDYLVDPLVVHTFCAINRPVIVA